MTRRSPSTSWERRELPVLLLPTLVTAFDRAVNKKDDDDALKIAAGIVDIVRGVLARAEADLERAA
jgi:hypothetical protein